MMCEQCGGDETGCSCPSHHELIGFLQTFGTSARIQARSATLAATKAHTRPVSVPSPARTEVEPAPDELGPPAEVPATWREADRFEPPAPYHPAAGAYPPVANYPPPARIGMGQALAPEAAGAATASLVLGLCSLVIPLAGPPGVILGFIGLRRIKRQPWLAGHGRAVAGIILSVCATLIGVVLVAIAIPTFLGARNHEDMARVQASVRSLVETSVQQATGVRPKLTVRCRSSEPRLADAQFYCRVTNVASGKSITVGVRETDGSGDFVVSPVTSGTAA
jgi:hypothetical protein